MRFSSGGPPLNGDVRTQTAMRFRSKRDSWLVAVLVFSIVTMFLAFVAQLRAGTIAGALISAAVFTLLGGWCIWMLFSTHYTFGDSALKVRCGPLRWSVPYSEILKVTPTRNPTSGPALSLDRLRLDYGVGKVILISPLDKAGFLGELTARCSNQSLELP